MKYDVSVVGFGDNVVDIILTRMYSIQVEIV